MALRRGKFCGWRRPEKKVDKIATHFANSFRKAKEKGRRNVAT